MAPEREGQSVSGDSDPRAVACAGTADVRISPQSIEIADVSLALETRIVG
jgi:hypothetical protein